MALKQQVEQQKETVDTAKKEQDDLFVLLTDQEDKLKRYKVKLKDLGAEVSFCCFNSTVFLKKCLRPGT